MYTLFDILYFQRFITGFFLIFAVLIAIHLFDLHGKKKTQFTNRVSAVVRKIRRKVRFQISVIFYRSRGSWIKRAFRH